MILSFSSINLGIFAVLADLYRNRVEVYPALAVIPTAGLAVDFDSRFYAHPLLNWSRFAFHYAVVQPTIIYLARQGLGA